MVALRISFTQQTAPSPSVVSRDQLREQIRQTIVDAQAAAREAGQQARDAQQQIRDAQQQVRDAQQQLREARTPDQKGAAEQALAGAQATLRELQSSQPVIVHTGQPFPPFDTQNMIPPQAVDISIAFFVMCAVMVIGWPLARAFGRRLERRGETAAIDPAMSGQLQRIEQAVEAMSIEVERISESQRFMAKLQSESAGQRGALPTAERR